MEIFKQNNRNDRHTIMKEKTLIRISVRNLVERGREMYSATLYKEEFLNMKKKVGTEHAKLKRHLDACNRILLEYKRECETYMLHRNLSHFILKLMNVLTAMEEILEEEHLQEDAFLEFYFQVRSFLRVYEELDENYVIYTEMEPEGNFKVKLLSVGTEDYAVYAKSPFDTANRLLLLGNDVSTKYTLRGQKMYERYAEYILRIV